MDKRYFRYFDWFSFTLTLIMLGLGLLFVYSATYKPDETTLSPLFKKQLFGAISGLAIYLFFCARDSRTLTRLGFFSFFFITILLIYTITLGSFAMGARRWVSLYFFKFQPSELVKLFLPAFIGFYFYGPETTSSSLKKTFAARDFLIPTIILLVAGILIMKQPDLGTAIIVLFTGFTLFWLLGLNKKYFLISGLVLALLAPVMWKMLKPYQQQRILVLMGYGDKRKEGYQIEQSTIAIGSGGFWGKGLLNGTQNKLSFLPEDHTDFIFSVICEETGFFGALLILFLFAALALRNFFILCKIPNATLKIIGLGLLTQILFSVCVNMGMVCGLLPIVGIPLPLFSYGISNLWITLASLGWLNNIAIRRFYF